MYYEWYRRKLEQNGVQIVSITQDFGVGPGADLTRRIMALTDEISSKENARHVRRAMLENARQDFWNGSAPPLGYKTVVAELRGNKEKKRLAIDAMDAEIIRLIFALYLVGDGNSGPLGIKSIVIYLNERGYKTPKGNKFHVSYVGKILRDEVYVGRAIYNRSDSRLKIERPKEDWITVNVPPIISDEDFQRAQAQLTMRAPATTPPRLVNSPVVLSGLAYCGGCGSLLLRQTGKGGKYQYYRCSSVLRKGSCEGGASSPISAPMLDRIVLDRLSDHLLTAERVQAIVAEIAAKREAGSDDAVISLGQLKEQRGKTIKKLANLINALADGTLEASETFKATVKATESDSERLAGLIIAHERLLDARLKAITLDEAGTFASEFREKLATSSAAVKKRLIRSFVGRVVVTADEIVITGAKSHLAEVVTGTR